MKYLGIICFAVLLKWTWVLAMAPREIDLATHHRIQQLLKSHISQWIVDKRPHAEDIRFDYLWTETVSENSIRANFSYSFKDIDVNNDVVFQSQEGYVPLKRMFEYESGEDVPTNSWSFEEVVQKKERHEFNEAFVIQPNADKEDQ